MLREIYHAKSSLCHIPIHNKSRKKHTCVSIRILEITVDNHIVLVSLLLMNNISTRLFLFTKHFLAKYLLFYCHANENYGGQEVMFTVYYTVIFFVLYVCLPEQAFAPV